MNPNTKPERPRESPAAENAATRKPWRKPDLVELDLSHTESGTQATFVEDTFSSS